jgi:hypothetical protein
VTDAAADHDQGDELMTHLIRFVKQYSRTLVDPYARRYVARVYGACRPDYLWDGWFVFFPLDSGRALATDRETTQNSLSAVRDRDWASGISTVDLDGALERALACRLKRKRYCSASANRLPGQQLDCTSRPHQPDPTQTRQTGARADSTRARVVHPGHRGALAGRGGLAGADTKVTEKSSSVCLAIIFVPVAVRRELRRRTRPS